MIPVNMNTASFGTVPFWRSVAPHYGVRTWKSAMRRFAMQHGQAIAMLADDSAMIVDRWCSKLVTKTIPADQVQWVRH